MHCNWRQLAYSLFLLSRLYCLQLKNYSATKWTLHVMISLRSSTTNRMKKCVLFLCCALSKDSFLQLNRQKANSFPLLPASFLEVWWTIKSLYFFILFFHFARSITWTLQKNNLYLSLPASPSHSLILGVEIEKSSKIIHLSLKKWVDDSIILMEVHFLWNYISKIIHMWRLSEVDVCAISTKSSIYSHFICVIFFEPHPCLITIAVMSIQDYDAILHWIIINKIAMIIEDFFALKIANNNSSLALCCCNVLAIYWQNKIENCIISLYAIRSLISTMKYELLNCYFAVKEFDRTNT